MSKNNILITSAGRRVELVQAFISEMNRLIPGSQLLTTDLNPQHSAACHMADGSVEAPRVTSDDYIPFLVETCQKFDIGLIIPTIDTELLVLADNASTLARQGIQPVISDRDLVRACRDKRLTKDIFNNIDIPYPQIYEPNDLKFPCFSKPYDGSCSQGAKPVYEASDVSEAMRSDDKIIYMELISDGFSEFTIDAYFTRNSELKCLVPRKRLEVRGGEISKGITDQGRIYEFLLPRLARLTGARGCLTVQVFSDPDADQVIGLEINPRFGGGYPLSYHAGANYPAMLINEYLLDSTPLFYDDWKDKYTMLRFDNAVYF